MSLIKFQQKIGVVADGNWGPKTLKAATEFLKLPKTRAVHFFAQLAHESGNFKTVTENLNYSSMGLVTTFKKYFPTTESTINYARNPEKIANKVYGGRMGNGNESSGDGYKYRGRGFIQLTGKENYILFSKFINRPDVVSNPDVVAEEFAFESAMFFFDNNKLWSICDKGINDLAIVRLTEAINGGQKGIEDRKTKTYEYAKILDC